jgi:hypothetical protein
MLIPGRVLMCTRPFYLVRHVSGVCDASDKIINNDFQTTINTVKITLRVEVSPLLGSPPL